MKQRCTNKKSASHKYYIDKGITICDTWNKFAAFLSDMGERPSIDYSLDRINSNGNYEPSNCRWVLKSTNSKLVVNNRDKISGRFK